MRISEWRQGLDKCEGGDIRELEVLDDDLSRFQVAEVGRAVPASPLTLRSMWISHFDFFDLGYDIWRQNDEDVLGVQPGGTM